MDVVIGGGGGGRVDKDGHEEKGRVSGCDVSQGVVGTGTHILQ